MTKRDCEYLAELTAKKTTEMLLNALNGVKRQGASEDNDLIGVKEAARILGLSPNYLRAKKDMFPYVKVGKTSQGRLLFRRSELLKNYTQKDI